MRYFSSLFLTAIVVVVSATVVTACEMRTVIREQITSKRAGIEINIDSEDLEDRIHEMVHSQLDSEKKDLKRERDRRNLRRESRRTADSEDDSGGGGWTRSLALAIGLYGVGLIFLNRRAKKARKQNTE